MKLTNPCKKILQLFKFRLRKPVFVRALKFRHLKPNIKIRSRHGGFRLSKILSALHSLRRKREVTDRVDELTGFSESVQHKAPHPSPLTPAYVRMSGEVIRDHENEVEDACRSFENYLIEMVVEDGKMTDLVDVEELLYCWKNLRSPVFMDLVCRFYGELCKDLFSSSCQNYDVKTPKGLLR